MCLLKVFSHPAYLVPEQNGKIQEPTEEDQRAEIPGPTEKLQSDGDYSWQQNRQVEQGNFRALPPLNQP